MEKRSVLVLALIGSGAAVLVAIVVLLIRVTSAASASATVSEIPPHELARAGFGEAAASAKPPEVPESRSAPARPLPAGRPGASTPGAPRGEAAPGTPVHGAGAGHAAGSESVTVGSMFLDDHAIAVEASAREVSSYYDRGDYETARTMALEVLEMRPMESDVGERMLRVAASSSCFLGDAEQARVFHARLTPRSKRDIETRCRRVGIEF